MDKFCGKCGSAIDTMTGLCPNCDREKLNSTVGNSNLNTVVNTVATPTFQKVAVNVPKKKHNVAKSFLMVALSICLFFTSLFSVIIFDARNTFDNTDKLLDNIDATDFLDSAGLASDYKINEFYAFLLERFGFEISDRRLDNFINRSEFKEFFADEIEDFVEDMFEGRAKLVITKKELVELIEDNNDIIEEEFGRQLNYGEVLRVADWVFEGDELKIIDSKTLKNDAPVAYYTLTVGFSYTTLIILGLLSAIIIFVLIKMSLSKSLISLGVVFMILGFFGSLLVLIASPICEAIGAEKVICTVVGNLFALNLAPSIVLLVLGIALLVVRKYVLKRFAK